MFSDVETEQCKFYRQKHPIISEDIDYDNELKLYNSQTKWMYFLIEDEDLLKKYNTIWDKVSTDIKKN